MAENYDENEKDSRGLLTPRAADLVRELRADEAYEIHDSIVIGPGAAALDDGWFNDWAGFSNAANLVWFGGRSSNVGRAYSNQPDSRRDWAFDVYMFSIEWFIQSPKNRERLTDVLDVQHMPELFLDVLPNTMPFKIRLAQADDVLEIPAVRAPASAGRQGLFANGAVDEVYGPGVQGDPHVSNNWKWPSPLMLPAQGQITVSSKVDNPMNQLLQALAGSPGNFTTPLPAGGEREDPVWYVIRCTFTGNRYLQLRGARSAR